MAFGSSFSFGPSRSLFSGALSTGKTSSTPASTASTPAGVSITSPLAGPGIQNTGMAFGLTPTITRSSTSTPAAGGALSTVAPATPPEQAGPPISLMSTSRGTSSAPITPILPTVPTDAYGPPISLMSQSSGAKAPTINPQLQSNLDRMQRTLSTSGLSKAFDQPSTPSGGSTNLATVAQNSLLPTVTPPPLTQLNIPNANPTYFPNVNVDTGLPTLDQDVLDATLDKYKGNTLSKDQYRDNWNKFGWNVKSDASFVRRGPAAVFGIDLKTNPVGATSNIVNLQNNRTVSDADLLDFASQVGITDTSPFYKGKRLNRTALFDALEEKTDDFYLVGNALDRTGQFAGQNKESPHAAIMFRSDGEGNLVPLTDAKTGELAASYYNATGNVVTDPWDDFIADFGAPLAIIGSFALPGIGTAITNSALGSALTTAVGSQAVAGTIINGALAGAMSEITGGDFLTGALTYGVGDFAANYADDVLNVALGGAENTNKVISNIKQFSDSINVPLTTGQIKDNLVRGLADAGVGTALDVPDAGINAVINMGGRFANDATRNFVASELSKLDLEQGTISQFSTAAGNYADVGVNAVSRGINPLDAMQYATPSVVGSSAAAPVEERDLIEERSTSGGNLAGYTQVLDAFGRPVGTNVGTQVGSPLAQAGADAPFRVDIGGVTIYKDTAGDLLPGTVLPEGYELADYETTGSRPTIYTTEQGQDVALQPITRPQYDTSSITGQAGAGQLVGPYFGDTEDTTPIRVSGDVSTTGAISNVPRTPALISSPVQVSSAEKSLPAVDVTGSIDAINAVDKTLPPVEVIDSVDAADTVDKTLPPVEVIDSIDVDDTIPPLDTTLPPIDTEDTPDVVEDTATEAPLTVTRRQMPTSSGLFAGAASTAGGLMPNKPRATLLETTDPGTAQMQLLQLQQLYPGIDKVDPALLDVITSRLPAESYYSYGAQQASPLDLYAKYMDDAGTQPQSADEEQESQFITPEAFTADAYSMLGLTPTDSTKTQKFQQGGDVHVPQFITGKTGYYVEGEGDGQSDSIPAMLADGEYVFDADTVAALGNGSNKAGAKLLDKMRQNIRKHKRAASHDDIPPPAKSPLEYLKG